MNTSRPIFVHKNKLITSAGITPYIFDNNELYLLFINIDDKYEDFGGKTAPIDLSIYDTASREADEESNGILSKEIIHNLLPNSPYFQNKTKYITYFVQLDQKYDVSLFGNIEITDQIERTVEWIKFSDIKDKKFHPRLNNHIYFNLIKKLYQFNF